MKKAMFPCVFLAMALVLSVSVHAENNSDAAKYREVMQIAKDAAAFLVEKGRDGFAEISDPRGRWVKGDLYVFVYGLRGEERGVILAHPRPGMVGKNFLRFRDRNGKLIAADFVRIAESEKGEGWSEYWWPKLDGAEAEPKLSYIMNIPGKDMFVGVGIYGGNTLEEVLKILGQ